MRFDRKPVRALVAFLVLLVGGVFATGCEYTDPLPATNEQVAVNPALCDTINPITYSNQVQNIFEANCYECHNSTIRTAGVVLDTYDGVRTQIDQGRIPGVIRRDPGFPQMPFGRARIDDCQIRTIERWIDAGAPNN